jgi:hypothetical protein
VTPSRINDQYSNAILQYLADTATFPVKFQIVFVPRNKTENVFGQRLKVGAFPARTGRGTSITLPPGERFRDLDLLLQLYNVGIWTN